MWNNNFLRVLSKYKTHNIIRDVKIRVEKPTLVRFGSRSIIDGYKEINPIPGINIARDKVAAKNIMVNQGINTPRFYELNQMPRKFPVLLKPRFGSKGKGIFYVESINDLDAVKQKILPDRLYFIEEYNNYAREYRFHVSVASGIFFSMRKLKVKPAIIITDEVSVWIFEENPKFNKPISINEIESQCLLYLKSSGLHFGAFDVKVAKDGRFTILEVNTAPALGKKTAESYIKEVQKLITYVQHI